jgi:hypothetical protein
MVGGKDRASDFFNSMWGKAPHVFVAAEMRSSSPSPALEPQPLGNFQGLLAVLENIAMEQEGAVPRSAPHFFASHQHPPPLPCPVILYTIHYIYTITLYITIWQYNAIYNATYSMT